MAWDAATYRRFADERSRPFAELLARVFAGVDGQVEAPAEIVDLGCGSGELTLELAERWPEARVTGVDSSPQMLQAAREMLQDRWGAQTSGTDSSRGRLEFIAGDASTWRPSRPVDLMISNATLQWVPGHLELLPGWVESLTPGGTLAFAVPANFDAPSHVLLRETANDGPWAQRLAPVLRGGAAGAEPVASVARYAEVLHAAGCRVDAWETTYRHVLDVEGAHGDDAVLAWVGGTALRPLLAALHDEAEREAFTTVYAERLQSAYPRRPYGTPFEFRRIFVVARR